MKVSRMNGKEINFYYPKLVDRWGEFCSNCQKTPYELGVDKLEIHEIRYERPLKIDNMRLMCRSCNNLGIFTKENISAREETAEYSVSRRIKPIFYEWLTGEMQKNNYHMDFNKIIADGAYYTGRAKETIKNWLYPLYAGDLGPYILWGDELCLRGHEPRTGLPERSSEFSDEEQFKSK